MFKHIFKLIWNKKRSHVLLIVEIVASFLVLFGVISLIVYKYHNYTQPLGYSYQNVWAINFDSHGEPDSLAGPLMMQIKNRILSYPQVESASLSSNNTPFSMSTSNSVVDYQQRSKLTHQFVADRDAARTLGITVLEGRWFTKADEVEEARSVVINQPLKEALFGDESALGKEISGDRKLKVIGVIGNYKSKGEYEENSAALFETAKMPGTGWLRTILIKVKPGTDATFEARLTRELGAMAKGWTVEVSYLENQRQTTHNITLVPVTIFLIVSTFLLINVALGLFGVLNLSIARRRSEIGLRRALGATETGISKQFVAEIWMLATFGMAIGLLFAGQFPLMNLFDLPAGIYITAMLGSIVVIYAIVTLCALFPSRQAARIQPAIALHEE